MMEEVHQSYDDFCLDALLQYDLADDEENEDDVDSGSVQSNTVDESVFDELYTSISDVLCDEHSGAKDAFIRSPSFRDIRKLIRNAPSWRVRNDKVNEVIPQLSKSSDKKTRRLMLSIGMLLRSRSHTGTSGLIGSKSFKRGIERNISTQTEATAPILDDDDDGDAKNHTVKSDDLSCSICYLDEDDDDSVNDTDETTSMNHSFVSGSEVFTDEPYDIMNNATTSKWSDTTSNDLLVGECYNVLFNNQTEYDQNIDIDDDTEGAVYDKRFKSDSIYNRSLPIIESRGLQDLFFDDEDIGNDNDFVKHCHRSVVSAGDQTTKSKQYRRPYTISDF
jgi:hypothetical protein